MQKFKNCNIILNKKHKINKKRGIYMSNTALAFVLTTLAGFSTLIGAFLIFFKFKNEEKLLAGCLSFAAGVMMMISVIDLMPEGVSLLKTKYGLFATLGLGLGAIILGGITSGLLDYFFPDNVKNDSKGSKYNSSLYKVGIIAMIAIVIHNIPEGIATFVTTHHNVSLGFSLALAISLHNIPEGLSIAVPIYYSTKSRTKALLYTLVSALSEPFGAVITYLFLINYINETVLGLLYFLIAGIMVYISMFELLPKSKSYNYKKLTYLFFFIGIVFITIFH